MIPKKIHFVWVGNNVMSTDSVEYIDKFKKIYFDYDIKIWNDVDIFNDEILPSFLQDYYYNNDFPPAFKADIVRYLLLNKYGGLYFDTDFCPIKRIPDCFLNFNFLGGIQNNGEVAIGFFASVINNELLNKVIELIPDSIESAKTNGFYRSDCIHKITGPEFFNKIARTFIKNSDYFFFSHEYFYPYWFDELHRKNENFEVTSPLSYSAHHWSKSWK